MSGRRYANGHGPPPPQVLPPGFRAPPAGVPIIGQRHQVQLAIGSTDGQPPTVVELISAVAVLLLQVQNIESDTAAAEAGTLEQLELMGDTEATLGMLRAACAFRAALLAGREALAVRRALQGVSMPGPLPADDGPAPVTEGS